MHAHIAYMYIFTKTGNVFPSISKGQSPQSTLLMSPCFAAFPSDAVFMCNQLYLGLRVILRNLPW